MPETFAAGVTEVFPIGPASAKPMWFISIVGLVLLMAVLALGVLAWSSRHARVEVAAGQLTLKGAASLGSSKNAAMDSAPSRSRPLNTTPRTSCAVKMTLVTPARAD